MRPLLPPSRLRRVAKWTGLVVCSVILAMWVVLGVCALNVGLSAPAFGTYLVLDFLSASAPLSILLALSAIPTGVLWHRDRRTVKPGYCRQCGYDLRASKETCPECGARVPKPTPLSSSHEEQDHKRSVARRLWSAPVICFGILTCLNSLFWLTVDFGSFAPASEGVLRERFLLFCVTETGPLSFFTLSAGLGDHILVGFIAVFILVLNALSVLTRRKTALAIAALIGIVVWFFFGFATAGLRIT